MENLAVCIPLDSEDIKYLNRCLRSVKAQTRRPDQLVICASRCTAADERAIRLICFDLGLQARIQTHKEVLFAGANRNRAAKVAVEHGATILFFFDSDDVMHPRRTEVIADHFKNKSVTGILTRCLYGPKEVQDTSNIPWRPIRGLIYMNAFRTIHAKEFRGQPLRYELYKGSKIKGVETVAYGPATVRAPFWVENPYSETIRIGEDQDFVSEITVKGQNLAYIPETLSVFMSDGRSEYDQCSVCCELDYVKQEDMIIETLKKRLDAGKTLKNLIEYRDSIKRKMDELSKANERKKDPSKVIYTFWTNDTEITENRKNSLEQLELMCDCQVVLVTKDNLHEYILPSEPLHPAYKYLSETHRSDYLRTYFMKFHGGGYSDIKKTTGSWLKGFEELEASDKWINGYTELEKGVVHEPVKSFYKELLGNCAYICKPNTPLTNEWYADMISLLDAKLEKLRLYPSTFPQDCAHLSNGKYPIGWGEMLGDIFHRVSYKYKDKLMNTLPTSIFQGYR